MANSDLSVAVFQTLRRAFVTEEGRPRPFRLRDKRNTQDDPLDEFIAKEVRREARGTLCLKARGPLITPDMVILRKNECDRSPRAALRNDLTRILAVEVKKLERTSGGGVARASGLDYNTTPPCGTVRLYDQEDAPLDVRCFYLFLCVEATAGRREYEVTGMVLCDGNALNADFDYYLSIVGERKKEVGLGTYGNGANRVRPMVIFANPLGCPELDRTVTLIHEAADLGERSTDMTRTHRLQRRTSLGAVSTFWCYRDRRDVRPGEGFADLLDPFPCPLRSEGTQARGRFVVPITLRD